MYKAFYIIAFLLVSLNGFSQKNQLPSLIIQDSSGKSIDLAEYEKGKTKIISFWATWCGPCKAELSAYSDKVNGWLKDYNAVFIPVSVDEDKSIQSLNRYAKSKEWSFPIFYDNQHLALKNFNIQAIPYLILVDKNGKIVEKKSGFDRDIQKLEFKLEVLK